MNKELILEKIEKQCTVTKNMLGFEYILQNQKKELINKIVDCYLIKYKVLFKLDDKNIDYDKYLNYIDLISNYLIDQIINKTHLSSDIILTLHKKIFSIFPIESKKNAGKLRTTSSYTYNLNEKQLLENIDYFISENKVKKLFIESINNLNKKQSLENIIYFFQLNISKIHPFQDGNGRVFYLLLDTLLIKNNYLPLFLFQNKKEYNIITEKYFIDRNFKLLNINFIILILNIYQNYNIE